MVFVIYYFTTQKDSCGSGGLNADSPFINFLAESSLTPPRISPEPYICTIKPCKIQGFIFLRTTGYNLCAANLYIIQDCID